MQLGIKLMLWIRLQDDLVSLKIKLSEMREARKIKLCNIKFMDYDNEENYTSIPLKVNS